MLHMKTSAEPIAIIGLGCRLPGGVEDWRDYWRLLDGGIDAISQTPADRWNLRKFYSGKNSKPGKTQSQWGGYVSGIDRFDPQLFGISPREAASMDPQQRLLLEVAFRAMEDAGQPLARMAGHSVAVFVGISSFDFAVAGLSNRDYGVIDAYSNTGGSSSIAANRISYCFDLRGPSVAVDTACSSSLVAIHLACESLWRGEAELALAGGVNALLLPDFYVAFSQLGVLSPDGRCKSFDARANGYVRSEGAGMALLKPLSAALRDKDPIYAVIRATALNQDGRTPGMTVPSQAAQEQLIRTACDKAGIEPQQLQYVEAHGTGTAVGDPLEAAAIGHVVGASRPPGAPCFIGSVKTNIGHLEAGAGIASLLKVALALHHRRIPASLHFQQANPAIDFENLGIRVAQQAQTWNSVSARLAGINGFGYGGANAHIILEQAPEGTSAQTVPQSVPLRPVPLQAGIPRSASKLVAPAELERLQASDWQSVSQADLPFSAPVLWPLSARSGKALVAVAQSHVQWLEQQGADTQLAEVAGFLAHRRTHHDCRATATATNLPDMLEQLRVLAASPADEFSSELSSANRHGANLHSVNRHTGAAFVCSGQGPQWWGMGRGLLKYSPAFRSVIKRCDIEFSKYGDWSLLKELTRSESTSRMQQTSIAQPSLFAIQVALASVWDSWGIKPNALVGHSVGEIAAAYLAGALSFEDAACVAFHRGRTMDLASSQGAMLAAGLSTSEVPRWLQGLEAHVSIAAINGPTSLTISGAAAAIDTLAERLQTAGIFCRRLAVEYAFHSPQMEPVRDELLAALKRIRPRDTHTPLISTVTGQTISGTQLGADYWWQNVRHSVRFSDAMQRLAEMDFAVAIEIGPHPVLAYAINECFQAVGNSVRTVPSLNRQQEDLLCITKSLGSLYEMGFDIHWSGFYNPPVRRLDVPVYPFQRQRCWSESLDSRFRRLQAEVHPLLGCADIAPQPRWQQRIDLKLQSYLSDHTVRGAVVYPAAAMLETALAAARELAQPRLSNVARHSVSCQSNDNVARHSVSCQSKLVEGVLPDGKLSDGVEESRRGASCYNDEETRRGASCHNDEPIHLQRVRLQNPCVLSDERPQWIETRFDADRRLLHLAFRDCDAEQWSPLATLELCSRGSIDPANEGLDERLDLAERIGKLRSRCNDAFDGQRLYQHCQRIGLSYGPDFRGVIQGVRRSGEALLEIALADNLCEADDPATDYLLHPALLDSCFHGMIAADPSFDHTVDGLYLPTEIAQVSYYRRPTRRVTAIVTCPYKSKQLMRCDLDLFDDQGRLCISLRGFESRRVSGGATTESTDDLIYSYSWIEQPLVPVASEPADSDSEERMDVASAAAGWIVLMDEGGIGQQLTQRLLQRGDRVAHIYGHDSHVPQAASVPSFSQADPESLESFQDALDAALTTLENDLSGIVYLWALDVPPAESLSCETLQHSTRLTALAPTYLVQAWEQCARTSSDNPSVDNSSSGSPNSGSQTQVDLFFVTAGAQASDGEPQQTQLAQSPLIGLGRVVASEIASLRSKLIDLPAEVSARDIDCLLQELLATDEEDEVMWRDGLRLAHRFGPQAGKPAATAAVRDLPYQLRVGTATGIDDLHYQTKPIRPLQAGEVEIKVSATGLNFSDVMKALGLYPGLPDGPIALGAECCGRIARVAAGSRWQVGDEVIAIAPGSFATHCIVRESLVARKPRNLSDCQAAALPIAFLTAEYALQHCARLQRGETVLIHAASGGVGLAAMQLAKLAGVRILATAGSEEKRRFVEQIGASQVMDSRSLDFAQQTLAATAGVGVDAVLNSLAGEAIAAGLSILKPGGRFLEIGKRDIYSDSALGLYPFRNNLALFAIDLDQLFQQQPERMGKMLNDLVERFEQGELHPLPTQVFSANESQAAYRFMQQGKHIGKVVVKYDCVPHDVRAGETAPIDLSDGGSFWIAGGLGGFGLEIARWLVSRGARSLVLTGRSSQPRAAAAAAIAQLQQSGVQVTLLPADITQPAEVRRVLETITRKLPPLRGVIHSAMVLEDKLLVDLDRATLERVLRPKVLGGWNLHHETRHLPLDMFVLFSSLSSVFGHAGQANYSAANALLDSLAYYRRAQGLPATVINWGHLGEVGYLAEREQLGQRLERQGVLSFTVQQATACLEYALHHREVQLSVLRIDWSVWRGLGITHRVSPRFAHLLRNQLLSSDNAIGQWASVDGLRELPMPARLTAVEKMLRVKAGSLLGMSPEQIPADRALLEMGLDSLMAVELRNWIESQLQASIAISTVMRSDSLSHLVELLCASLEQPPQESSAQLQGQSVATSATATPGTGADQLSHRQAAELLERLPDMPAEQVAQLLGQMLGGQSHE